LRVRSNLSAFPPEWSRGGNSPPGRGRESKPPSSAPVSKKQRDPPAGLHPFCARYRRKPYRRSPIRRCPPAFRRARGATVRTRLICRQTRCRSKSPRANQVYWIGPFGILLGPHIVAHFRGISWQAEGTV